LLITAILLLHLKQDILEEIENSETPNETPINASIPLIKIEESEKNQETPHAELETLNLEASHIEETDKNKTHVELETLNLETSHYEETDKNKTHAELETLNLETSHYEEIPSAYHFLNVLGKKTKKYWKISIHWLKSLNYLLADPFDERAIEILGEL
jgi:hypothetical protein